MAAGRGVCGGGVWVNTSTFCCKNSKANGESAAVIAFLAPGTVSCKSVNWQRMSFNLIRVSLTPPVLRWRDTTREKEREEEQRRRGGVHLIPEKTGFLPPAIWCLGSSLSSLQSLTAGPISSAASPSPGRIPFDQARSSAEHGFHLLAPAVLKLVAG